MRSPAVWLARRELAVGRGRAALAAAVIAAIAAAVTAIELVARGREEAIAAQIDAIGAALTVVPPGVSAGALARYELGEAPIGAGVEEAVRAALGGDLRAVERRLVVHREVAGARVPVVGHDAAPRATGASPAAALGSELARRLGDVERVPVAGREYAVSGVLPSAGSVEDLALFLPLEEVRALSGVHGENELRLLLRAGASARDAEARLARGAPGAAVIRSDRGDVADREAQESLSRHRAVAYLLMAGVGALCLAIAAHLDAAERRVELATLVAIGARRTTVVGGLLARSAILAAAGGGLGVVGGAALVAAQGAAQGAVLARSWALGAGALAAALAIGVVAAAPTAVAAVLRDPVRDLQET